jgi:hypothetical protein
MSQELRQAENGNFDGKFSVNSGGLIPSRHATKFEMNFDGILIISPIKSRNPLTNVSVLAKE